VTNSGAQTQPGSGAQTFVQSWATTLLEYWPALGVIALVYGMAFSVGQVSVFDLAPIGILTTGDIAINAFFFFVGLALFLAVSMFYEFEVPTHAGTIRIGPRALIDLVLQLRPVFRVSVVVVLTAMSLVLVGAVGFQTTIEMARAAPAIRPRDANFNLAQCPNDMVLAYQSERLMVIACRCHLRQRLAIYGGSFEAFESMGANICAPRGTPLER